MTQIGHLVFPLSGQTTKNSKKKIDSAIQKIQQVLITIYTGHTYIQFSIFEPENISRDDQLVKILVRRRWEVWFTLPKPFIKPCATTTTGSNMVTRKNKVILAIEQRSFFFNSNEYIPVHQRQNGPVVFYLNTDKFSIIQSITEYYEVSMRAIFP